MKTIVAMIVVALQTTCYEAAASQKTYYEAKVSSFGCTSIKAVSDLQKVRTDAKAFQAALLEKQMYGECVAILTGTLVEGSIEAADDSILRVNYEIDPPGYEAPLGDFEATAKAASRHGSSDVTTSREKTSSKGISAGSAPH